MQSTAGLMMAKEGLKRAEKDAINRAVKAVSKRAETLERGGHGELERWHASAHTSHSLIVIGGRCGGVPLPMI